MQCGQQWCQIDRAWRLPGKRLPLSSMRFARPIAAAAEIQFDVCMFVAETLTPPERGAADMNAQLLVNLANKRFDDSLIAFDFTARKFPEAGVGLAHRALREEHLIFAINNALDDGDGDAR